MKLRIFTTAALLTTAIAACAPTIALAEVLEFSNGQHPVLPSWKTPNLQMSSDFPLPLNC